MTITLSVTPGGHLHVVEAPDSLQLMSDSTVSALDQAFAASTSGKQHGPLQTLLGNLVGTIVGRNHRSAGHRAAAFAKRSCFLPELRCACSGLLR